MEMHLLLTLVLGILAWQYLTYLERAYELSWTFLFFLLASQFAVSVVQSIVILKPLSPKKKLVDNKIYKDQQNIFKSVGIRVLLLTWLGPILTYLFGSGILISKHAYLIRSGFISLMPIALFWSIIGNVLALLSLRMVNDTYIISAYQLKKINYSEVKKYGLYILGSTFVLGAIVEAGSRQEIVIYVETYLFILSSVFLIARIYRPAAIGSMQNESVDKILTENLIPGFRFYFIYIFICGFIGGLLSAAFILFLKRLKP